MVERVLVDEHESCARPVAVLPPLPLLSTNGRHECYIPHRPAGVSTLSWVTRRQHGQRHSRAQVCVCVLCLMPRRLVCLILI